MEKTSMESENSLNGVWDALLFATEAHGKQTRANGSPYILHPTRVMKLIYKVGMCPEMEVVRWKMMQAALLHDVMEDCGVNVHGLTDRFGAFVSGLVMELTQDKSLPRDERRRKMIEHCGSMSRHAQMLKLADRLDNMREMGSMSDKFIARYCAESRQMLKGMSGACPEFEAEIRGLISKHEAAEVESSLGGKA